jgi:hypothetical protein
MRLHVLPNSSMQRMSKLTSDTQGVGQTNNMRHTDEVDNERVELRKHLVNMAWCGPHPTGNPTLPAFTARVRTAKTLALGKPQDGLESDQ